MSWAKHGIALGPSCVKELRPDIPLDIHILQLFLCKALVRHCLLCPIS